MYIPEDITEFLYWVKERTEAYWAKEYNGNDDEFYCEDWAIGAKWIGMEESEIDAAEQKYGIRFTPDHRAFLRILHTIDRKEIIGQTESFDEDAPIIYREYAFFYNWLNDEEISEKLSWPYVTILDDVLDGRGVWLESWGKRPNDNVGKTRIFTDWYANAPKLIPLTGHRFMVSDPQLDKNPVLSVWGSDTIVFGWSLRTYLLNELRNELDLHEYVFDEDDQVNYGELIKGVQDIFNEDFRYDENKHIPYWEELILFWSSGWSGFGKKYPHEDDSFLQPIVKTYIAESEKEDTDENAGTRRFKSF